ncbi:protein disulfide-isomerase 2-like [Melanaphis sacchari]|uniref:protein disulfide-isomerase 2-like n=1 Tax=Melanaphis sacchari TaxID=742174 RepID=UPI000DC1387C|nr:protein disulfide-isomerase 2-like [Melanaphis sacchari]
MRNGLINTLVMAFSTIFISIEMDTPDDDGNDDADAIQALFLTVLAIASWPSTNGNNNDHDNENDYNVGWQNMPGGSHVRTLDETNFQQTITGNCCVLVFFHAKWCRYCGPIKPVFAEVAATLQGGHPIVAAAVDCSDDDELAIMCNINALPTMLFYRNGEQVDKAVQYRGDWSATSMQLFAVDTSATAHKCLKVCKTRGGVARKKLKGHGQTGEKKKKKKKMPS